MCEPKLKRRRHWLIRRNSSCTVGTWSTSESYRERKNWWKNDRGESIFPSDEKNRQAQLSRRRRRAKVKAPRRKSSLFIEIMQITGFSGFYDVHRVDDIHNLHIIIWNINVSFIYTLIKLIKSPIRKVMHDRTFHR